MSYDDDDPFAERPKAKAISWSDAPVGAEITGVVDGPANKVHQRDYDTSEPMYWDDEKQKPRYQAVVNLTVDGEVRSLWAPIPSSLFSAISSAQSKAGVKIAKGGTLTVRVTGYKQNPDKPRRKPARQFAAKYVPGVESDPWASDAPPPDDEPPF